MRFEPAETAVPQPTQEAAETMATAVLGPVTREEVTIATEDGYAANSSRTLAETAVGETQLKLYNGAGHGTNMFAAKPELTSLILDWLGQRLDR